MKSAKCLLLSLFTGLTLCAQNEQIDSLAQVLERTSDPTAQIELLYEMSNYAGGFDFQEGLIYARRGYNLAKANENKSWQAQFSESTGRMHANLGNLDSASVYFEQALNTYKAEKNLRGEATTLFKMAWLHQRRGEFEAALQDNLEALKLMEAINDEAGIADALGRISGDLYNQEKYAEAYDYAQRAIVISRQGGYNNELPYLLYSLGYAALGLKEYDSALTAFDEALEWVQKLELGLASEADMHNSRGNALKKAGRYELAIEAYQKAMKNAASASYLGGMLASKANLGEVYYRTEAYEDALPFLLEVVAMNEEHDMGMNLTENYNHLSNTFEQLGDYQNALVFERKARAMRDSTASEASDAAMSELLTRYETEQKEATIALQQAEISQQRQIQWLSFGLVGLLAIFAMSFYRNARARKKINALLSAKNEENELLLKEIHHRVKNNLEVVSSLLALQSAQIDDPKVKDAMLEGQNRVHSIGIVHQKLYQGTNIAAVEMKDYFINLSDSILDTFGADDRVTIECAMNQLELDIDTAVPLGLIVNELLTNALKYAFPDGRKGKIRIEMNATEDASISLKIADDGIGISGAAQGTGFGSQLVALLTRQLDGSLRQEANDGTIVYLDFRTKRLA